MDERGFGMPITIKTAIDNIDANKYLIPAIQRKFVWTHEKIENLFDSIMRDYPINSFMFWQITDENIKNTFKFYKFITHYRQRYHEDNEDIGTKGAGDFSAIIDGQQRLTSIYVGLKGSYAYKMPRKRWNDDQYCLPTRYLYLDISAPLPEGSEEKLKYNFAFKTPAEASNQTDHIWFKVGDILAFNKLFDLQKFISSQSWSSNEFACETLYTLRQRVFEDKTINFYNETNQDIDNVLDIFIRTNSGGIPLSFSNLLMSITTANWKTRDAREEFESLIKDINQIGKPSFWIDGDFILKTCLVLFNENIRFMVKNFDHANVSNYEDHWTQIRESIVLAFKLIEQWGYNEQTLRAKNAVIPLIYFIYNSGNVITEITNTVKYTTIKAKMRKWLNIVLIKGTFGGQPDYVLTGTRRAMKPFLGVDFPLDEIVATFKDSMSKNLTFSEEDIENILSTQKDDPRADSIMSLLYSHFSFDSINYNKDHLHPASYFLKLKQEDCASEEQYKERTDKGYWNTIINLQLLDESRNKSKQAMPLKEWVETVKPDLDAQLIPRNIDLCTSDIDTFFKERKKLLAQRLRDVLSL
jgi:uncharacterized protein with ParB-like and HNH nuclease domain